MTIDPYSVIPILLIQLAGMNPIGTATGFLWRDKPTSQYYLVTNYHVLSGRNPLTDEVLDPGGQLPTAIRVLHNGTKLGTWKPVDYRLHDSKNHPLWREHPRFGHQVGVVLLPVELPKDTTGYAINDAKWVDLELRPAESVSILGFPKGETAGGLFAIWQTGYVASEPAVNFNGLPGFLVDSHAWPGNSGSPVIARRYGSWSTKDGGQAFGLGGATDFEGVFSMVIGHAEMKFVWKPEVINEILH